MIGAIKAIGFQNNIDMSNDPLYRSMTGWAIRQNGFFDALKIFKVTAMWAFISIAWHTVPSSTNKIRYNFSQKLKSCQEYKMHIG